jgi:hypothetical protein
MPTMINPEAKHYPVRESATEAVARALAFWGGPELSAGTHGSLVAFSRRAERMMTQEWEQVPYRIMRQNALRALIPTTPDWQTC